MKNNKTKPAAKLIGENGNIFNSLGIATRALRKAGLKDESNELSTKLWECGSYDAALALIMTYVEVY